MRETGRPAPERETPAARYAKEVFDLRARTRKPGEPQISVRDAIGLVLDNNGVRDRTTRTRLFREIGAEIETQSRIERWSRDAERLEGTEARHAGFDDTKDYRAHLQE